MRFSFAPRLSQPARLFALSAVVELGAGCQQLARARAAVGWWVVDRSQRWPLWVGVVDGTRPLDGKNDVLIRKS